MKLTHEEIAEICHEANRSFCHAFGDYSNPPWGFLSPEMKASTINGVEFHLANPDVSPAASHENWMKSKTLAGWKYGAEKSILKKEHPNLVPYGSLPQQERAKDIIFSDMVNTLKTF